MLDAVVQNVSTKDLLKCRQINLIWNESASRIMSRRADIALRFGFYSGRFMHKVGWRKYLCNELRGVHNYTITSNSLTNFVNCLKESANFPYTNFHFDDEANFANFCQFGGQIFSL